MIKSHNPLPLDASFDPEQLWYVSDARIRTKSAADDAKRVAEWVELRRDPDFEPDEQMLFAALHTSAYRAARKSKTREIPHAEREL